VFKIAPQPQFEFDAQLTVPGQDAPAVVRLVGRNEGRQALQAWIESARASSDDATFLGQALAGWKGVFDETGVDVPFSQEALARLLDAYPASGGELFEQYVRALSESRRKN